ncbi:hypothetical protein H9P43_002120 [Blastocladiella emersonii ATCC 22665]|nr:hypothetical protein H9P43_002120 [Blastocladiella emersonii ATCC 22665]
MSRPDSPNTSIDRVKFDLQRSVNELGLENEELRTKVDQLVEANSVLFDENEHLRKTCDALRSSHNRSQGLLELRDEEIRSLRSQLARAAQGGPVPPVSPVTAGFALLQPVPPLPPGKRAAAAAAAERQQQQQRQQLQQMQQQQQSTSPSRAASRRGSIKDDPGMAAQLRASGSRLSRMLRLQQELVGSLRDELQHLAETEKKRKLRRRQKQKKLESKLKRASIRLQRVGEGAGADEYDDDDDDMFAPVQPLSPHGGGAGGLVGELDDDEDDDEDTNSRSDIDSPTTPIHASLARTHQLIDALERLAESVQVEVDATVHAQQMAQEDRVGRLESEVVTARRQLETLQEEGTKLRQQLDQVTVTARHHARSVQAANLEVARTTAERDAARTAHDRVARALKKAEDEVRVARDESFRLRRKVALDSAEMDRLRVDLDRAKTRLREVQQWLGVAQTPSAAGSDAGGLTTAGGSDDGQQAERSDAGSRRSSVSIGTMTSPAVAAATLASIRATRIGAGSPGSLELTRAGSPASGSSRPTSLLLAAAAAAGASSANEAGSKSVDRLPPMPEPVDRAALKAELAAELAPHVAALEALAAKLHAAPGLPDLAVVAEIKLVTEKVTRVQVAGQVREALADLAHAQAVLRRHAAEVLEAREAVRVSRAAQDYLVSEVDLLKRLVENQGSASTTTDRVAWGEFLLSELRRLVVQKSRAAGAAAANAGDATEAAETVIAGPATTVVHAPVAMLAGHSSLVSVPVTPTSEAAPGGRSFEDLAGMAGQIAALEDEVRTLTQYISSILHRVFDSGDALLVESVLSRREPGTPNSPTSPAGHGGASSSNNARPQSGSGWGSAWRDLASGLLQEASRRRSSRLSQTGGGGDVSPAPATAGSSPAAPPLAPVAEDRDVLPGVWSTPPRAAARRTNNNNAAGSSHLATPPASSPEPPGDDTPAGAKSPSANNSGRRSGLFRLFTSAAPSPPPTPSESPNKVGGDGTEEAGTANRRRKSFGYLRVSAAPQAAAVSGTSPPPTPR